MADKYINKVIIGNDVKLDLTADDITADKLAKGIKAHDKSGAPIVGTSTFDSDTFRGHRRRCGDPSGEKRPTRKAQSWSAPCRIRAAKTLDITDKATPCFHPYGLP